MLIVPDPPEETVTIIDHFINDRLSTSGQRGVVLGLSGGLDSALVLKLAVLALGSEMVHPVFLPNGSLSERDRGFARAAAEACGTSLAEMDISPLVGAFPMVTEGMALANLQARLRMTLLYAMANTHGWLVLGTSNKTELMLGYFTKYGDGASDLCPIGDLLKTQARTLARTVGVPAPIIDRVPTAGLMAGQTDEGEMRMPYPLLDRIILGHLRHWSAERIVSELDPGACTEEEMARSGLGNKVPVSDVSRILSMIERSRHKRDPLIIPKITANTIGVDLRERW